MVVAERVDLGGAPATRAAYRPMAGVPVTPFFATAAESLTQKCLERRAWL